MAARSRKTNARAASAPSPSPRGWSEDSEPGRGWYSRYGLKRQQVFAAKPRVSFLIFLREISLRDLRGCNRDDPRPPGDALSPARSSAREAFPLDVDEHMATSRFALWCAPHPRAGRVVVDVPYPDPTCPPALFPIAAERAADRAVDPTDVLTRRLTAFPHRALAPQGIRVQRAAIRFRASAAARPAAAYVAGAVRPGVAFRRDANQPLRRGVRPRRRREPHPASASSSTLSVTRAASGGTSWTSWKNAGSWIVREQAGSEAAADLCPCTAASTRRRTRCTAYWA